MFKTINLDNEVENMENDIYLNVMENTLKRFLLENLNLEVEVFKSLKDNTINIYSETNIKEQLKASVEISNKLFVEKVKEYDFIFLSGRIGAFKLIDLSNNHLNTYVLQLTF